MLFGPRTGLCRSRHNAYGVGRCPWQFGMGFATVQFGLSRYSATTWKARPGELVDAEDDDDNVDDDAPYFSLVTGGYVSQKNPHSIMKTEDLDLAHLPGQGQVTEYNSEAANFLKQREYQGLETLVGQTEAKAAVPGLSGIASNYSGS